MRLCCSTLRMESTWTTQTLQSTRRADHSQVITDWNQQRHRRCFNVADPFTKSFAHPGSCKFMSECETHDDYSSTVETGSYFSNKELYDYHTSHFKIAATPIGSFGSEPQTGLHRCRDSTACAISNPTQPGFHPGNLVGKPCRLTKERVLLSWFTSQNASISFLDQGRPWSNTGSGGPAISTREHQEW